MVLIRIAGSFLATFLVSACAAPLWGQAVASAQISGSIIDSTGATVAGAKVTVTQNATQQVRTTLSGSDGAYVLPSLPVGPYQFEVQAVGFNTYVQTGIHLEVSNDITLNVTLRVGEMKQQVEVTANASMVETQSTCVSPERVASSIHQLTIATNDRAVDVTKC